MYSLFVLICVIAAFSSYVNVRYFKLPKAIGLTVISALISLLVLILVKFEPKLFSPVYDMLDDIGFKKLVLKIFLGYLLFASAMHLNFSTIKKFFVGIAILSSVGVILSTFIIGSLCYLIAPLVTGVTIGCIHCLIVGAILSPTDPVAVFAVFKTTKHVPEKIKATLSGEASFNDVFSIVIFLILLSIIVNGDSNLRISEFVIMLIQEGAGGVVLGLILGMLGVKLMAKLDDGHALIIISLALVSLGSWLATRMGVSEPLAMVLCGIVIGNSEPSRMVSDDSRIVLSGFWGIVDELLNAFLFVLVGIEALRMDFSPTVVVAGVALFGIMLFSRYWSVLLSLIFIEKPSRESFWKDNFVMTWAGLRGGVSIALVLTIPVEYRSDHASSMVYIAVLLSIFIQGITFKKVLEKAYG